MLIPLLYDQVVQPPLAWHSWLLAGDARIAALPVCDLDVRNKLRSLRKYDLYSGLRAPLAAKEP